MRTEGETTTAVAGVDLRGLISNSLSEWDGRIAAVVFTAGCNWRCPFCHGRQFVEFAREETALPRIPVEALFALLDAEGDWIDGVVLSGGEPTLQPGLVELLRELGARGVPVRIQSNGSRPGVLETLLEEGLLASLCLDYKAPLDERLARVANVAPEAADPAAVRRSFALAAGSGLEREYRTTLCPAFVDEATLEEMGRALEPGGRWSLQQYEPLDVLDRERAGRRQYSAEELDALTETARRHHADVVLRPGRGG